MKVSILFVDDESRNIQAHQKSFRKKKNEWGYVLLLEGGQKSIANHFKKLYRILLSPKMKNAR